MPSVYCKEIFAVVSKAAKLLSEALNEESEGNIDIVEVPISEGLVSKCEQWRKSTDKLATDLQAHYSIENYNIRDTAAAMFSKLLAESDEPFTDSYELIIANQWLKNIRIQSNENWLIKPYENLIEFKDHTSKDVKYFLENLPLITKYLKTLSPFILDAMDKLISDLIVASHKSDDPGIFSFSDDKAPNVLYFSTFIGTDEIPPEDIADSILHEFCHQVLFHMDSESPFLKDSTFPQFSAPWRAGSRPSGGFLHGTFVFSFLTNYWSALCDANFEELDSIKLINNRDKFKMKALYGIASLNHFALLTERGQKLLDTLLCMTGETEMPTLEDLHFMIENRAIPMKNHI